VTIRGVIERVTRQGDIFPVSITPKEAIALHDWVVREHPVQVIEVGLAWAFSTLHICEALREIGNADARLTAIDPNQATAFENRGLQVLDEAGVGALVELVAEPSQIALPELRAAGRTFDFAFVDANHRFDGVFVDLVNLAALLESGSAVFIDDYQLPSIRRAVSFFTTNRGWTVEEQNDTETDHHWIVLRTATEPDTRPFDHFVDF
jgi:predicted O-methyltransferase YrrM